jgi:nicotinamide riboside kinase
MTAALRLAIVGAESTGKSTLALALVQRLRDEFGVSAVAVAEYLREWCETNGRTPRLDEQRDVASEQQRRIDEAAASADVVVCDTTPLMTAVYSRIVFDDDSLDDEALAWHAAVDLTLLTALDLPWIADGLQRDGPHVRGPVDALVRAALARAGGDWTVVSGSGPARADHALDAVRPVLRRWVERRGSTSPAASSTASQAAGGLFTRLLGSRVGPARPMPRCERCDSGECEHLARRP